MRFLKYLAIGLGALLGLVVVGIVFVALTFDPNDYKEYAQDWVAERTGRSLTIDGDIELSVFPWLAIETGHVELGNAQGFGPEPFVAAQRVSARVRLMPLVLRQEFEIGTVSMDGLEVDLAVAEDGTTNWADLTARQDASAAQEPGSVTITVRSESPGLDIEGVELRGARVTWRENGEPRFIVSELFLSTGAVAPSTPVDIDIEAHLLDVATQRTVQLDAVSKVVAELNGAVLATDSTIEYSIGDSSGRTDIEGSAVIDTLEFLPGLEFRTGAVRMTNALDSPLAADTQLASSVSWQALEVDLETLDVAVEELDAEANGIRARLQLTGENLAGDAAVLRGRMVVEDAPAEEAIRISGIALPAELDANELGNFSASTAFVFDLDSGDVELNNLDLSMLDIALRAQAATLRGDRLTGDLSIAPFRPSDGLRRLVAPWVPDGIDVSQLGAVALSTRINGSREQLELTGMRLSALGAEISGAVRIDQLAADPVIAGDISSNQFSTSEIFAVLGEFVPDAIRSDTAGTAAIAGRFTWDSGRGLADVVNLRLEAFGMQGNGDVRVTGIGDATEVSGAVQLAEFDPRNLLGRFDLAVPQTSDDTALRRASIASQFQVSPTAATFEDLSVSLDDSRISGSFVVTDFDNPLYRFTLAADQLDVDRYLPPQEPPGADNEAAPETSERRAGDMTLSREALSAVNVDANVSVGQLRIAGMDFSNVATSLVVGSGRMLIDSAHADLYGGTFDGRFHVDASTDVPTMLLQGNAANLQLAPLIVALAESANFSGVGSFDIDLQGRGPTVTDNLRSAAGTMGFELANGAIEGFNVDKTLCRAFNTARGQSAPRDMPDRSTFESIRGTATVTDGIATTNDLIATVDSAQVRGSGTLALADQVMDYSLEARLTRAVPIAGCAEMERIVGFDFPLEVTGPVSGPDISPDYSEVIQRVLEYQLRESVRDRILESLFD